MEDSYEQGHQLRALAMRVAALEDNVAFLEHWCEEQQDALDRAVGSVAYDYEVDVESALPRPKLLRVVDLRDDAEDGVEDGDAIVALVDPEHDRTLRVLRAQLNRLRVRLAASLTPPVGLPEERPRPPAPPIKAGQKISAKPAGRTAP
ncbi:MAG TPA: hypothetical protein VG034_20170 [Acidimicrobiia bacterium]|jgi:hypothetical protein|nr:hypothetical protein [Acidimicrobiia bacterium]